MKKTKRLFIALGVFILILAIIYFIPESRKQLKTSHFTLYFSSGIDTSVIGALASALEENYLRIGQDLQTKPSAHIDTYVYASRWRYIKATGNWGGSGNIEGTSKLHFLEQGWGESDHKKVAIHEFAHTITLKLLIEQEVQPVTSQSFDSKFSTFPTWLWEGISVYEANQFVDPKTLPYLSNGHYPSISELNSRLKGGKIYSCGYTIIEYLLSRYGQDNLISLVKNYGDIKKTLGVTDEEFGRGWYQFVKGKYLQRK